MSKVDNKYDGKTVNLFMILTRSLVHGPNKKAQHKMALKLGLRDYEKHIVCESLQSFLGRGDVFLGE